MADWYARLRSLRAATPEVIGDRLAGLFALAREEVLRADGVIDLLDDVTGRMPERDFLVALPALRQAFHWFPPRERETIAGLILARRGHPGPARDLLRPARHDPGTGRATALEDRVDALLAREGLA